MLVTVTMDKKIIKEFLGFLTRLFLLIIVMISGVMITTADELDTGRWAPTFTNVSVHDPSVIKVEDQYYIFGSHLGVAKTDDLMNWDLVHGGVVNDNPIIPNVFDELSEVFSWAETRTLWAADVTMLQDGRYYMYYNACEGSSPRSAMGVAVADHIEGPYEDLGIFLKSGMWGSPSPDGQIYNANIHPNVVDPHVFYDHEGKPWMVYGSYSGGIFILEMDEATAKPVAGQGYGKHLFGGNHLRIEGAYMQYSAKTDYYYLFVTFGGLGAGDGYNLRVMRAKTPDGDFQDITGNHMKEMQARPGIMFDDEAIASYGNKMIGDFNFSNLTNSPDFEQYGYISPGHNSTYYEESNGKYYNIFHTRFPNRGEAHEVRVHQMFMNQEGWFVLGVHRYTGEALSPVTRADIVGSYHYLNHGKGITDSLAESVYIQLNDDATISGTIAGTWELEADYFAVLNIVEEDGTTSIYKGVFIEQWDSTQQQMVMTFTALSESGISIWGSGLESYPVEELLTNVANQITLPRTGIVYEDLDLPTMGPQAVEISWQSSNEDVVATDGTVNRPSLLTGDIKVTLTATLTKGQESMDFNFEIVVKAQHENPFRDGLVAYYDFNGTYNDILNLNPAATVTGSGILIPGTTPPSFVDEGIGGESIYFDGNSGLLLPLTVLDQADMYTVSFWIKPEVLTEHTPTFFVAVDEANWMSLVPRAWDQHLMLWSRTVDERGDHWYDGRTHVLVEEGEWTHVSFTYHQGDIAIYVDGINRFNGTEFGDFFQTNNPVIALGVNYWDIPFQGEMDELRIYERALKAEEIYQLATLEVEELEPTPIELDSELAIAREKLTAFLSSINWEDLKEADYPKVLWETFIAAYEKAQAVLATSEEVTEFKIALETLEEAYERLLTERIPNELEPPEESDQELATARKELTAFLVSINWEDLKETDYPKVLWETFIAAYEKAQAVLATSKEVTEFKIALETLAETYEQLLAGRIPVRPSLPKELDSELVTAREELTDFLIRLNWEELNETDYPKALWEAFMTAYEKAQAVVATSEDLSELRAALSSLSKAYERLLAGKIPEPLQFPKLPEQAEQNLPDRLPQTGSKQSLVTVGFLFMLLGSLCAIEQKQKKNSN